MPRSRWAACLLALLMPLTAFAQSKEAEELVFFSTDQVELAGTFYPSQFAGKAPAVMLLHRMGGSRQDPGWRALAEALQKKGFAVLAFDFRGHGASTTVSSDFWNIATHRALNASGARPTKINHEMYTRTAQAATLVNDIAAAKRVLDLKARDWGCDSANVVLVGADSGATLGALWLAAEWQRWRTVKDALGMPVKQGAEGHDIAGAIWLNISSHLNNRQTVPVADWLGSPVRERVPMLILHDSNDGNTARYATSLFESVKAAGKDDLHKLTTLKGVSGWDRSANDLFPRNARGIIDLIVAQVEAMTKAHKTILRARADADLPPPLVVVEKFGIR